MIPMKPEMFKLRTIFNKNGFDIRICGGFVRDWILHKYEIEPHDIDLCTDATPDEQRQIYEKNDIRHIDTGLKHGTWTIVMDQTYEITSLRTDTDCDGRHAKVKYTRDWILDLGRRDLTFNSMLMDLDGEILDPFNGISDLLNGIVRFVGEPNERIREDYLRILRWFRFHARIGKGVFHTEDTVTCLAIVQNMHGLQKISRERVWSEFKRIISDPNGLVEIAQMLAYGIASFIDLPTPETNMVSFYRLQIAHKYTKNSISLMAAYLGSRDNVILLANAWKWSNDERDLAFSIVFFIENNVISPLDEAKRRIVLGISDKHAMIETMHVLGLLKEAIEIKNWNAPVFPIRGADLLNLNMKTGPNIGEKLSLLKAYWIKSNYAFTKNDLINILITEHQ